jgi:hypothetical protein
MTDPDPMEDPRNDYPMNDDHPDDPTAEDALRVAQHALTKTARAEGRLDALSAEIELLDRRVTGLTKQTP